MESGSMGDCVHVDFGRVRIYVNAKMYLHWASVVVIDLGSIVGSETNNFLVSLTGACPSPLLMRGII